MIKIELIIHTKQHRWLDFPLWTSNQEKQDEASLCSCTLWVGLMDLESWYTLEDTSRFQNGQE